MDDELQLNDPRVQRLLKKLSEKGDQMEGRGSRPRRSRSRSRSRGRSRTPHRPEARHGRQGRNLYNFKSPSDTTIYIPALRQDNVGGTPTGVNCARRIQHSDRLPSSSGGQSGNGVTPVKLNFVGRRSTSGEHERDGEPMRKTGERTRSVTDDLVLEAECFKASIEPPKGINNE